MTNKLWILALVSAATFSAGAAYAHGDDRHDRDWQEQRHDDWRHHQRRDEWRYDHRRPAYGYDYDYRPAPRYEVESPVVFLPLPPPPNVVLRELLHGHR